MITLGVLGSTRGTDLQAIIDAIEAKELDAEIALVASDKKGAFILERAKKHGIETLAVDYSAFEKRGDAERPIIEKLKEKKVDLVLLIGFMKIITPQFADAFRGRIWNIHPSLLPKYAGGMGRNVHEEVLANHEKETGCTLHEAIAEVDAGKIIMQKKIPVDEGDTVDSLKEKVQKLEQECFLEAIKSVIDGKLIIGGEKE